MAAVIQIHEMASADDGKDKTAGTIRFKAADDTAVDINDPLVIPGDGQVTYSYCKQVRAYMETPPSTQISNLRWYSDGANGFGAGITVSVKNLGTAWTAHYSSAMAAGADLFDYNSASAFDGDSVDAGPFVVADDDAYIGDIIELQMAVSTAASQGALTPETLTLAYDEI